MRKTNFSINEYYHLFNRGNSKQKIFHDKKDYERFIKMLFLANSNTNFKFRDVSKNPFKTERGEQLVAIGTYCLMPNHFHLLVTELEDNGISKFMQKITTAYSMYYNIKYKRTGGLFEGRYKSEHLYEDRYLKYIFSYIHLNPIKLIQKDWRDNGIKDKKKTLAYLEQYEYSSYIDYRDEDRIEKTILNKNNFPEYFTSPNKFNKEILDWITYADFTQVRPV